MSSTSVLAKVSSFFWVLEPQKSSKELYEQALKLCDEANDGMVGAKKMIDAAMANDESPLNGFFAVTGAELYVLTDLAKFESTRGANL